MSPGNASFQGIDKYAFVPQFIASMKLRDKSFDINRLNTFAFD